MIEKPLRPLPSERVAIMKNASGVRTAILAWTGAVVLSVGLVAATQYTTRDPDSRLYAGIAAHLSQQPIDRWIAPEWWGFWGHDALYCEHPVGIFLAPAALARLGFPAEQAAYAVNVLYQAASLCLLVLVARVLVEPEEARALAWLLQLLPIAFVFRIRANQEYALLAGLLLAVYSTERARSRPIWTLGMTAGFCGVLLVKGVFALSVPVTCAVWLVARTGQKSGARSAWPAWGAIGLMPLVGALCAWGYDAAYLRVTGRSFLAIYRVRQVGPDAMASSASWWRVPYTAVWYLGRIVWYAFPWSPLAGWIAWRAARRGEAWPWARRHREARDPIASPAWQGAWFAVVSSLVLTAGFSLAERKADRYLFPVYFILGAAGAIAAMRRFGWLRRLVERLDRPWVPAVFYVVLFLAALLTAGRLPAFTFWRS
jgi:4-amino-4-deoxy-L-arabinose transferase-like glycosyltransferase